MKALTILIFTAALLFFSCDTYPQNVNINVSYQVEAGVDSAYLFLWKGENINDCPFVEDADYKTLDFTGIQTFKLDLQTSDYGFQLQADGENFKVAGVVFADDLYSDLATSGFYVLPKKPAKMIIGTITITF